MDVPPVPAGLLDLAGWVSRYYLAPMSSCLRLVLPPGTSGTLRKGPDGRWRLRDMPGRRRVLVARLHPERVAPGSARRREVVAALERAGGRASAAALQREAGTTLPTIRRMAADGELVLEQGVPGESTDAGVSGLPSGEPLELNEHQAAAYARIEEAAARGHEALLLHGVTGSGKTEVYLRAIAAARDRGRSALVLVPEIALSPQLLDRLRARLGDGVALWHSGLTPARRAAEYRRVREGRADVVLGARSAAFAPLSDLGLVIVDEEHDASYKQDSTPRYDARQVAFVRARREGAVAVYGSATPRPESWRALPRVTLPERADGARRARVQVVDMKTQPPGPVSRPLARALRDAMGRGEKAIILLNRRGFALMEGCRACGWIATCPSCDVALVRHRSPARLVCHHCGREERAPELCPSCGAAEVGRMGSGTQGLESTLARIVPGTRLVRLDADAAASEGGIEAILSRFAAPGAAILLGTQMVAKGHDLPAVTVAGVLDADGPLGHADFRAEERAFSLIVQAVGRAGRRGEAARAFVQAYRPAARAVDLGVKGAVEEFLAGELVQRERLGFPPYGHLARLVVEGEDEEAVTALARAVAADAGGSGEIRVLGPARLHRLRGRYRRAVVARAERAADAAGSLAAALTSRAGVAEEAGLRAIIDVDPQAA